MLQEGTGNTMTTGGYGTAFQAVDDEASTIASITEGSTSYAEKQSTTDNNVNTLCEKTVFLTHQINVQNQQLQALQAQNANNHFMVQPPNAAYFTPQQAIFQPQVQQGFQKNNQAYQPMDTSAWNQKRTAPSTFDQQEQNRRLQTQPSTEPVSTTGSAELHKPRTRRTGTRIKRTRPRKKKYA